MSKRLTPTFQVIRELFARSGNECFFPGCNAKLISDKNLFVAEIAHICAARKGGPRFDSQMVDEERRGSKNLIVLCHPHHVEVDSLVDEYPVERLLEFKEIHERQFREQLFATPEAVVAKIASEAEIFWSEVESRNRAACRLLEVVIELEPELSAYELLEQAEAALNRLEKLHWELRREASLLPEKSDLLLDRLGCSRQGNETVPYWNNPLCNWNWDLLNLAIPNTSLDLGVYLRQLAVRTLELQLTANPDDARIKELLRTRRKELLELSQDIVWFD